MATATKKKVVPVTKLVAPKKPAKKAPAKKKNEPVLRNEVAFVLDGSGSMSMLTSNLVQAANSWLDKIQKENKTHKQLTNVTRVDFGTTTSSGVEVVKFSQSIDEFERLGYFRAYGNTPLFDAVTLAVDKLSSFEKTPDTSMLVVTITDGEENASKKENVLNIGKLIRSKQAMGTYTFVFMVPPGRKAHFCSSYEIPQDNVIEWEATTKGLRAVEEETSKGFTQYFASRSAGHTQVNSFYATPDLSDLTTKEIKKACKDIQNECKVYEVPKEVQISEFVEAKTGEAYRGKDGKAYYQLTKREEVQPSKQVLIMEKGKRAIFGGNEARELIGLHNGATDKVTPGNHANYDIFIQSTSNNRALVRGTKLIVRG